MLVGGNGSDSLDGGTCSDSMNGGANDDTFLVDAAGDIIVKAASEGTNPVLSAITLTLGANVENLQLTGSSALNGTGKGLVF